MDEHVPALKQLARGFAKRCRSPLLDSDDAFQVAYLAFVDAAARFDPSRGCSVRSFAMNRARGALIDELRKVDFLTLTQRRKGDAAPRLFSLTRFDREKEEDEDWPMSRAESSAFDKAVSERERADMIEYLFRPLHGRERLIAELVYVEGLTLEATAARIGVTSSRLSQVMAARIRPVIEGRAATYVAA